MLFSWVWINFKNSFLSGTTLSVNRTGSLDFVRYSLKLSAHCTKVLCIWNKSELEYEDLEDGIKWALDKGFNS